ncbi:hypothetical protein BASA81_014114 [Batrachochytrium salamandrivorans]|nr:hypothetical protein BASA81_014114 [Batrachochytrium salamandrivorans]
MLNLFKEQIRQQELNSNNYAKSLAEKLKAAQDEIHALKTSSQGENIPIEQLDHQTRLNLTNENSQLRAIVKSMRQEMEMLQFQLIENSKDEYMPASPPTFRNNANIESLFSLLALKQKLIDELLDSQSAAHARLDSTVRKSILADTGHQAKSGLYDPYLNVDSTRRVYDESEALRRRLNSSVNELREMAREKDHLIDMSNSLRAEMRMSGKNSVQRSDRSTQTMEETLPQKTRKHIVTSVITSQKQAIQPTTATFSPLFCQIHLRIHCSTLKPVHQNTISNHFFYHLNTIHLLYQSLPSTCSDRASEKEIARCISSKSRSTELE